MDEIQPMSLREFLKKFGVPKEELALRCGITVAAIYNYLCGQRVPRQKIAERIERETGGRVTVKILRGSDDREKR